MSAGNVMRHHKVRCTPRKCRDAVHVIPLWNADIWTASSRNELNTCRNCIIFFPNLVIRRDFLSAVLIRLNIRNRSFRPFHPFTTISARSVALGLCFYRSCKYNADDRSVACGIMSVIDRSPVVIDISRQNGSLFACIYLEHDFAIKLVYVYLWWRIILY